MPLCCNADDQQDDVYLSRKQRHCTDLLCVPLLIAAWAALATITVLSFNRSPTLVDKLRYPEDDYGQFCGKPNTDVAALPNLLFPVLDNDINSQLVFLASAPYWEYYKLNLTSICVASCPTGISFTSDTTYGGPSYPAPPNATLPPSYSYNFYTENIFHRCLPTGRGYSAGEADVCWFPNCTAAKSEPGLGVSACATIDSFPSETETWLVDPSVAAQASFCQRKYVMKTTQHFYPEGYTAQSYAYTQKLAAFVGTTLAVWENLIYNWPILLVGGFAAPLGITLVWCILLYLLAGVLIWTLVVLLLAGSIALDVVLAIRAGILPETMINAVSEVTEVALNATGLSSTSSLASSILSPAESTSLYYYYILSIVSFICTLLLILWILASWRAVRRAIAIVEESSTVFSAIPAVLVWPLVGVTLQVAVAGYGLIALVVIAWPETWDGGSTTAILSVLHVTGVIWTINFIKACNYTTISMSVAYWFVKVQPESGARGCAASCGMACRSCLGFGRIAVSAFTVATKHFGSMAFGSAIMTICNLARLALYAVFSQTKNIQQSSLAFKLVMKCAMCAAWCLEKTVEMVSRYAYVHIASSGGSFCGGCKESFSLIAKYPAQTAVNQMVKSLITILLAYTTPVACFLFSIVYLDRYDPEHSSLYPAFFVFVLAYITSSGSATVYECTIDTIYLCSFGDMETNKPVKYMSAKLRAAFGIDSAKEEAGDNADYYRSMEDQRKGDGSSTTLSNHVYT